MPPKFDPNDPAVVELVNLFKQVGLSESKATDAARTPKNAAALKDLIIANDLTSKGVDEKKATLLVSLSISGSKLGPEERTYAVNAILDGKLKSTDQLNAAVKYLESHRSSISDLEFDKECGVGFTITPEEILTAVRNYVSTASVAGWNNITAVLGTLKGTAELRWAPTLEVKTAVETVFLEKFGPKEAARAKVKEPKEAKPAKPEAELVAETTTIKTVFEEGFLGKLHKPGGNPQIHPRLREGHLAATGGQVYTRFPPEPNGFLHIGHSKAIFVNFGYAAHHNGKCYLRYDDTNPEAEEGIYFESILESVRWLGFEPYRITYSSDYFQELYDLAVDLIRRDKAYICHCTPDEMVAGRGGPDHGPRIECTHRNRPIEDSIAEFQDMKEGKYRPGTATLRMKQDILGNGNPHMWDMVAYRTLDAPHHRTGTKWKIYPTYDYTHCLVDSFENISHSLCTTEFILARESYEWLCDALEVYKPRQSEYGRLNLQGTIMSKRKIIKLVKEGHVTGWDDPRLYTIVALRRRGVPPGAILSFVGSLGVSTALTNIQTTRFEQAIRQYLENTAPRLLMVLHPLKVTIENIPEGVVTMLEKPLHPKIPALGTSSVPLTRTIYIEEEDFRVEDQKDYFRLAPGKTVGLFGAGAPIVGITCTSFKTDPATGKVTELICYLEDGSDATRIAKKPKAFIQWVADHAPLGSPVRVHETRIFHQLFKSDNPAAAPNFLDDISPNTLEVVKGAMVEVGFWSLSKRLYVEALTEAKQRTEKALKDEEGGPAPKSAASLGPSGGHDDTPKATIDQLVGNECVRFQGLRVAYFALDKDAKLGCLSEGPEVEPGLREGDHLVLNRIVSLKEDSGKAAT